jgi:hypothetical protein
MPQFLKAANRVHGPVFQQPPVTQVRESVKGTIVELLNGTRADLPIALHRRPHVRLRLGDDKRGIAP